MTSDGDCYTLSYSVLFLNKILFGLQMIQKLIAYQSGQNRKKHDFLIYNHRIISISWQANLGIT